MVRNVIGSILALVGAAAAVWSPFHAWYDGRHGRDYRVADLFGGISRAEADLWTSIVLPFAFAALVTLVGLALRSRVLIALAGLIVLAFAVLWMVRQGQAAGSLSVESDGSGLGQGVALALGGGLLLLLGAAVMSGRRPLEHDDYEPDGTDGHRHGRHGRHGRAAGGPERHDEPYAEPYAEPYGDRGEPYGEPDRSAYGQRPYAGDAPTAEYPRYDERYDGDGRHDDRPGGPEGPPGPYRGRG
ncbi:hypothetical protein ACPB9J_26475 [Streptomyces lavendulocolor]|uniref:hypothetical protein n=1 Tax=Streptomyces lavendulocolor TaxID=67316 RepID=UPI003C2C5357